MFNRGTATVTGVNFDPGVLANRLPGLDFNLMNASFADFSDVRIRRLVQMTGINYRLSPNLLMNVSIEYHRDWDDRPYLFDSTGRRVLTYAGLNWIF